MNDSSHLEGHRDARRPRSPQDSTSGGIARLSVQVPHPDCCEYLIAAVNGYPWQRPTTRRSSSAIGARSGGQASGGGVGSTSPVARAAVTAAVRVWTPSLAKIRAT